MFLDPPGGVNCSKFEIRANHKGTEDTKKPLDSPPVSLDTGDLPRDLKSEVMGAER
jgi:hypothetical protein